MRLQICVTIVFILQILAGIILMSMTADFHRTFAVYLIQSEKQTLLSELSNIYLQGFEVIVCYSAGWWISRFVWKSQAPIDHIILLAVWNGISFLIIISGLVYAWFLFTSLELLQDVVESLLFNGIDAYFSNAEWKLLWDEIQYRHECCGVYGYEDWKNASWIPNAENSLETTSDPGDMMLIPYACCKRSATFCFQTYAPHLRNVSISSSQINSDGCLFMFINRSARYYINIVTIILCVIVLHMLLFAMQITFFCKIKKESQSSKDLSDELPLIIVKYPRSVRCITLRNDDNLKNGVEDDQLQECKHSSQDVCDCQDLKRTIFIH